jgi:hypothetical protein
VDTSLGVQLRRALIAGKEKQNNMATMRRRPIPKPPKPPKPQRKAAPSSMPPAKAKRAKAARRGRRSSLPSSTY